MIGAAVLMLTSACTRHTDANGLTTDPSSKIANTNDPRLLGMYKRPVAAGRGTGNRPFDVVPGDPRRWIMPYRLASTDPGEMMPELGRTITHKEGWPSSFATS